jgi:hypothetical protein
MCGSELRGCRAFAALFRAFVNDDGRILKRDLSVGKNPRLRYKRMTRQFCNEANPGIGIVSTRSEGLRLRDLGLLGAERQRLHVLSYDYRASGIALSCCDRGLRGRFVYHRQRLCNFLSLDKRRKLPAVCCAPVRLFPLLIVYLHCDPA